MKNIMIFKPRLDDLGDNWDQGMIIIISNYMQQFHFPIILDCIFRHFCPISSIREFRDMWQRLCTRHQWINNIKQHKSTRVLTQAVLTVVMNMVALFVVLLLMENNRSLILRIVCLI